jgi:hypothetical protein
MATLAQIIGRFFPGATEGSIPYGSSEGFDIHAGNDFILPAGTPVRLPETGTLVWSNGYQNIFRNADNTFTDLLHVATSGLVLGQTYQAGSTIGTVSPLTGWPLSVAGSRYWSDTPHVHYAVFDSLNGAIADQYTNSVNPLTRLGNLLSSTPASSTGGGIGGVLGAAGNAVGGALGAAGNAINSAGQGLSSSGTVPYSAVPGVSNVTDALGGVGDFLTWVRDRIGKGLVLLLIGLAAVLIVYSLVSEGMGTKVVPI